VEERPYQDELSEEKPLLQDDDEENQ